jgi:nicotine blue oxidoreductase
VVAAVVLAAGGGQRSGGPEALLRSEGQPLIERAVRAAHEAGCAPVVVVLGCEAARVRAEAALNDTVPVDNPGWRSGAGSSLRVGLEALAGTAAEAVVLLTVAMVGVGAEAVRRVSAGVDATALRTAAYEQRRSYPVLLGRDHWAGVATLAVGDLAARAYLSAHADLVVTVACEDIANCAVFEVSDPAR